VLPRNCLLKYIPEENKERGKDRSDRKKRKRKQVASGLPSESERILEIERIRSTLSHCVENLLWKGLWTCRKTEYRMNE
jgi:hypothetical protein